MQKIFVTSLVLLSACGFLWSAAAQETPPPKEKAAIPFEDPKEAERPPRAQAKHRIDLSQPLAADKTLEEQLEARGSFQAEEATLKSFAAALETALDTSVVLATKKLEEAAINTETPLTYKLKNVRIKTALKLILGGLGLTYVIEENILLITTPEDAGSRLETRVYDCRDLLKLPSTVKRPAMLGGSLGSTPKPSKEGGDTAPAAKAEKLEEVDPTGGYSVDDLIEIITSTVHPDSWDFSGPETIPDFKGFLVISQTQEMHTDIEKLLNQLHKAGGLEEKVNVSR